MCHKTDKGWQQDGVEQVTPDGDHMGAEEDIWSSSATGELKKKRIIKYGENNAGKHRLEKMQ